MIPIRNASVRSRIDAAPKMCSDSATSSVVKLVYTHLIRDWFMLVFANSGIPSVLILARFSRIRSNTMIVALIE